MPFNFNTIFQLIHNFSNEWYAWNMLNKIRHEHESVKKRNKNRRQKNRMNKKKEKTAKEKSKTEKAV